MPVALEPAAKWQQDCSQARTTAAKLRVELEQWEQLATQAGSERAKQGAQLRAKVMQLKLDLERLQRDLDGLALAQGKDAAQKLPRKDELAQAFEELKELQRRIKGPPSAPASTTSSFESLSASFARQGQQPEEGRREGSAGAELQPVTQRQMLQMQQERMRAMDEQAADLEGSVQNLQNVSHMILGEIRSQNTMLEHLNEDTERVQSRLGRARTLLRRFGESDRNRCLLCGILLLLAALIALFVYVLGA